MRDWLCMLIHLAAFLVGVLVSAWFSHARAAELNVLYFSQSRHIKADTDETKYNERNQAFGLEAIGQHHGFAIGRYHDSFGTTARYVGGLVLTRPGTWRAGFEYGIIRSPSYASGQYLPFVIPYLNFNYKMLGFNLLALPKFTSQGAYVFGLQYKVRFEL